MPKEKLEWYSGSVVPRGNRPWFYFELKAKDLADAKKRIKSLLKHPRDLLRVSKL